MSEPGDDRWPRLWELFDAARSLEGDERATRCRALLDEAAAMLAGALGPGHPERLAAERERAGCPAPASGAAGQAAPADGPGAVRSSSSASKTASHSAPVAQ